MATPKVYFDACAFIEVAKGRFGRPQSPERVIETQACKALLDAANDGEIQVYTSMLTLAEAVHIGDVPPPEDVAKYLERLLLSGRNGVVTVSPDPFVVMRARELTTKYGINERAMDRIHVASAIHSGCQELITVDGRLAERIGTNKVGSLRLTAAVGTASLPDRYRTSDLFQLINKNAAEKAD